MKGRRICMDGTYDHTKEILLGPRTAPGLEGQKAQGMATNPAGFFVITPFYFKNGSGDRH
jgi:cytochrome oxidase assembly protein ShyY1